MVTVGINRFSTAFFFLGFTIVSSAHSQDVNPATPTDTDCPTTVKASLKATSLKYPITIKEACTQHNGQAASALAEIKNARTQSAEETKTKLAARLRPCRAETWKLSRARALNPRRKALLTVRFSKHAFRPILSQAALKSYRGVFCSESEKW